MLRKTGFTLIELLLVISLTLLLGTMTSAFGSRFLTQSSVGNTTDLLVSQLRKAQMNAMLSKGSSNWGVSFQSNAMTLYRGNSYNTRAVALDEKFSVDAGVQVSGLSDVNFSKVSGFPGTTPTITISGAGETETIIISSQGMVSR